MLQAQESYPIGSIESWAGPLSRFDYDGCSEDGVPLMGALQEEDADVAVCIYVATHCSKSKPPGSHATGRPP